MAGRFLLLVVSVLLSFIGDVSAFKLTILHTNDVHARVEQTNKYSGACSPSDVAKSKCFGGFARIKTKVDEIRNNTDNVLFLDGGDQSQGTMWFYKFPYETVPLMNDLTYDAMTLGNHEFDRGVDKLVAFLQNANFSIVSCNVDLSRTPNLAREVNKSAVFTVAGQKIGVVGYTTVETTFISNPEKADFNPVIPAIQAEVDKFRNQSINKIIALGHAGFNVDKSIAEGVRGVDIVVGGHSNTFLYNGTAPSNEKPQELYPYVTTNPDGDQVLVVQDYAYGKYLGRLDVEFDDYGVITSGKGNPILLDKSVARNADMLKKMQPFLDQLTAERKEVVGETRVFLKGDRGFCRKEECNMGNLITDAWVQDNRRRRDTSSELGNVVIAIINSGGIRSSINKGNVTVENILTVQPFRNTVDVVEMTGQTILDALEYCAKHWVGSGDLFGGFLQVSGMKIVYDMRRAENERVVDVQMLCGECEIPEYKTLNKSHVYKVLMSTFVANGGDGYSVFKEQIIKSYGNADVDSTIFMDYMRHYSPVSASLDGRIRFLDDSPTDPTHPTDSPASTDSPTCNCRPNSSWYLTSSVFVLFSVLVMITLFV